MTAPNEVRIYSDNGPYRPVRVVGPVRSRIAPPGAFARAPAIEDVNMLLQDAAAKLGANAVINVTYQRGLKFTSWKALTARGTAIVLAFDGIPERGNRSVPSAPPDPLHSGESASGISVCPNCLAPRTPNATRCSYCGGYLAVGPAPRAGSAAPPEALDAMPQQPRRFRSGGYLVHKELVVGPKVVQFGDEAIALGEVSDVRVSSTGWGGANLIILGGASGAGGLTVYFKTKAQAAAAAQAIMAAR
jgi:hypothetical protein